MIKKDTLRTSGGAGISQQEDALWHKLVTAHKETSSSLSHALALVTRRLATEYVDPEGLEALLANRGIAIDKCPGLRPVGVGEMCVSSVRLSREKRSEGRWSASRCRDRRSCNEKFSRGRQQR